MLSANSRLALPDNLQRSKDCVIHSPRHTFLTGFGDAWPLKKRNTKPTRYRFRYTQRADRRKCLCPCSSTVEQLTHNLLVRGSNPCGGTNQLARVLTFTSSWLLADSCSTSRWREDGAIWEVRDSRVMKSVPSAVADGFDDPDTLLRLNLTTLAGFLRPSVLTA